MATTDRICEQDFATYALPIRDNITMGAAFDADLMTQCLHESGVAEFTVKLPKSYNKNSKTCGSDLSMGQWQNSLGKSHV